MMGKADKAKMMLIFGGTPKGSGKPGMGDDADEPADDTETLDALLEDYDGATDVGSRARALAEFVRAAMESSGS